MIRYLQTVDGNRQVGAVRDDGRVELLGAARSVFASMQRSGGDDALRRLMDEGWSNGYLYLASGSVERSAFIRALGVALLPVDRVSADADHQT